MARKVLVRLVDDLDGLPSEGVATVTFSLDGVTYSIDLNQANASKLRDGLADYITSARRIGGRMKRGSAAGGRSAGSANDGPAIREWAREQGHELAERGRIPSHIVDAYHAANRGGRAKAPVRAAAPVKAAAASKTALAKATAPTGKATRAARGTRPAAAKATKAPATKSATTKAAPVKATAKATTAKPAAKTAAKTTTAKATTAKPAAKTPRAAAKSPRATKSTVTAKTTGQRGRRT